MPTIAFAKKQLETSKTKKKGVPLLEHTMIWVAVTEWKATICMGELSTGDKGICPGRYLATRLKRKSPEKLFYFISFLFFLKWVKRETKITIKNVYFKPTTTEFPSVVIVAVVKQGRIKITRLLHWISNASPFFPSRE